MSGGKRTSGDSADSWAGRWHVRAVPG